jgi:heme-degrading monooxygenase HmoA
MFALRHACASSRLGSRAGGALFTTTAPACKFPESEAAKIVRERSRRTLEADRLHDEGSNDNVYRLSRRTVAPGTEDQIKELMNRTSRKVRRVDGLIDVEVLVDAGEPQAYNVLTRWEDQASLDAWVASDACKQVRAEMEELLAEPLEVRTFRNLVPPVFLL